jgi:hypothetical protein
LTTAHLSRDEALIADPIAVIISAVTVAVITCWSADETSIADLTVHASTHRGVSALSEPTAHLYREVIFIELSITVIV